MIKKPSKVLLIASLSLVGLMIIAGVVVSIFYKPYMAVYLTTGDVYFGKTSVFPCVRIQDPWFLQRTEDGGVTLERFADAAWMPKGKMRVNKDQIVFMSRLSELSSIVAAIEGRNVPQQQATQQQLPGGSEEPANLESTLGE
jgi:hypothetical protein